MSARSAGLLAHLAPHFRGGEENAATEALGYILNASRPVRSALAQVLGELGARVPSDLVFRTQVADPDQTTPDLVGVDVEGRELLIIESKFWAGLTAAQPAGYLDRLQRSGGSILLFVVPAARFETLWPALLHRATSAGFALVERRSLQGASGQAVILGGGTVLGIVSWTTILDAARPAAVAAGEEAILADIAQLAGFCGRMDEEGFFPLRSEELTGNLPARIGQYKRLVDDAADRLRELRVVTVDGIGAQTTGGFRPSPWYGRYFRVRGHYACLRCDPHLWSRLRPTPLWLQLRGPDWRPSPALADALRALILRDPPDVLRDAEGGLLVPLWLPVGKERDDVLQAIVAQVADLASMLPAAALTAADAPTVPAEALDVNATEEETR
ncbi:MAG TPA: hypothetical protein VNN07_01110 [Candidatus Tectomicrobia bacterium]|nr:hypothetical protein [Candidatus Tectomicrobia bacterium]